MADLPSNSTLPLPQQTQLSSQTSPHPFRLNPSVFSSGPSNGASGTLAFSPNNTAFTSNSSQLNNFPVQTWSGRCSSIGGSSLFHSQSVQSPTANPSRFQQSFSAVSLSNICQDGTSNNSPIAAPQQSFFPSDMFLRNYLQVSFRTFLPQSLPSSSSSITPASSQSNTVPNVNLTSPVEVQSTPPNPWGVASLTHLTSQVASTQSPATNPFGFSEPVGYARTQTSPALWRHNLSSLGVGTNQVPPTNSGCRQMFLKSKTVYTKASTLVTHGIKYVVHVTDSASDGDTDLQCWYLYSILLLKYFTQILFIEKSIYTQYFAKKSI